MPGYIGLPDYAHGSTERLGILLVNLGTPDDPHPGAVRRFLAEFLWDPRVIETPRLLWWVILHGVILRIRPSRSSHAYRQIWTDQGSPLMRHTRELAQRLQEALSTGRAADSQPLSVELAMTYGSPSIPAALRNLRESGLRRLLVLPLYPQYSGTTTASVFDRVTTELQRWRWLPEVRFINNYHNDPAYIAAIAASVERHWQTHQRRHLLFSFHSTPKSYLLAGDPYHCQCLETARLVSEKLLLAKTDWSLSFQSRVGRQEWLRPYTDELLIDYAAGKHLELDVVCPGFAADNLETLEEIEIRNRELFLGKGGKTYHYIPALNASADHVAALADLVRRHTQGWPTIVDPAAAERSRERALQAGAAR